MSRNEHGYGREPGQNRGPIKNGGRVYKGTARGPQRSGAHKPPKDTGCRSLALVLLAGSASIVGASVFAVVEAVRAMF